ncbi:hypothetical protein QFC21_005354 [Naganishia friedmannii]|uniref:Uncharacterized protein n=1 Tax=Naganishia friedmannii TaxID=89922 RepID=A0ACC2VA82_9TREE|nr:hypothetical protein QFC21_005354 [Naganishia friedmannii]
MSTRSRFFRESIHLLCWVPVGIFFTRHIYSVATISGASMQPTFNPGFAASPLHHDVVLLDRWTVGLNVFKRGEVVTLCENQCLAPQATSPEDSLLETAVGRSSVLLLAAPRPPAVRPRSSRAERASVFFEDAIWRLSVLPLASIEAAAMRPRISPTTP